MEENQTLNDKLDLVLQYKNEIKTAINNKGQTATNDLSTYSNLISQIVDYTGTISPTEYNECLETSNEILGETQSSTDSVDAN